MMNILVVGFLAVLFHHSEASSVTRSKVSAQQFTLPVDRIVPLDTERAGRDLELRKVQALLSGPRTKNSLSFEPHN
jgi:hypothetical protein